MVYGAKSNPAETMINEAIDADIAEQEIAIEQGWRSVDAADNALARYTQTYGSVPAARETVRSLMLAQAGGEYRKALLDQIPADWQPFHYARIGVGFAPTGTDDGWDGFWVVFFSAWPQGMPY